jgi:hypothetical protein
MNAKHELIRELEKRGLHDMARKARTANIRTSPRPTSTRSPSWCKSLRRPAIPDLAARAKNGDFDQER